MKRARKRDDARHESTRTYDGFLGGFVDAVQLGSEEFQSVREVWSQSCPVEWQEQFTSDATEIESLIVEGFFAQRVAV